MKISQILVHVAEVPGSQARSLQLVRVPGLDRVQYTHTVAPLSGVNHVMVMRVRTAEGIEGICTFDGHGGDPRQVVQLLRTHAIGADPLRREELFQMLHLGTRWLYQRPGWFGTLDNCLWDIAGKAAGLPVYSLLGKNRDGVPAYLTAGDGPVEMYIEQIEQGRELGIRAYKPHSYKGGKADIPIMERLRAHVGPDYALMLDPVCSYSLREAIEVGHVLEELGFIWLEEPFHEQRMNDYQELCAELVLPVMANETLMYDMNLSAQWLIHGATDRLRANARHGATQVLKMAHLAELYGTNIELNGAGGLFGHVHAQLGCAIANNSYYEHTSGNRRTMEEGPKIGLLNPPEIIDGELVPADGPGWGAEWDLKVLERQTVEVL